MKPSVRDLVFVWVCSIPMMLAMLPSTSHGLAAASARLRPSLLVPAHSFVWASSQSKNRVRKLSSRSRSGPLHMSSEDSMVEGATKTLAPGSHLAEHEVKKSRFLGYAQHAETWEEAQAYIAQVKEEHPKARHWCYGVQFGVNPVSERCSDDGEPTGTAGLPILGAIQGEELSDVVCVVVRYFGGVKLGAGGLIRAYGAAARQVLREAPYEILIPKSTFSVSIADSSFVGVLYDGVSKVSGGVTSGETYGADGSLTLTITCDTEAKEQLQTSLSDATRGSIQFLSDDDDDDV